MFNNKEFYPTPSELLDELLTLDFEGVRLPKRLGERVLEPSAGKGDIIEYIKKNTNIRDIDAIEYDITLANELTRKKHTVIHNDFLTFTPFKQYDSIVMNPPFSNGDEHLLKAIEVAESNVSKVCNVYAIINAETIKNPYTNKRKELRNKLNYYGAEIRFVEGAFSNAERKTNVEVALISIEIKPSDNSRRIYERILDEVEIEEESPLYELSTNVRDNEVGELLKDIPRLIAEYQKLVDVVRESHRINVEREKLIHYVEETNDVRFFLSEPSSELDSDLEKLRAKYWRMILQTDKFAKKLTTEAREQLLRSSELVADMDVTEDNVRMIFGALLTNFGDMVESSIVEVFKRITDHAQREGNGNIHLYNGWKTNDAYKINKKIIYPVNYSELSQRERGINHDGTPLPFSQTHLSIRDFVGDLNKACGTFTKTTDFEPVAPSEYENNVMHVKIYIKGTVHVTFKDSEVLDLINITAGRHFNWIPSEDEVRNNKEAETYMRENFGTKYIE